MLDDSLAELSDHVSVQDGQARAGASAIARRHALLAALLHANRPTVERLAALANGMAQVAEPYADVFIRAGLKPDFIPALRPAPDDMVQALKDRTQSIRPFGVNIHPLREAMPASTHPAMNTRPRTQFAVRVDACSRFDCTSERSRRFSCSRPSSVWSVTSSASRLALQARTYWSAPSWVVQLTCSGEVRLAARA